MTQKKSTHYLDTDTYFIYVYIKDPDKKTLTLAGIGEITSDKGSSLEELYIEYARRLSGIDRNTLFNKDINLRKRSIEVFFGFKDNGQIISLDRLCREKQIN